MINWITENSLYNLFNFNILRKKPSMENAQIVGRKAR
jgi:hypothetical protein